MVYVSFHSGNVLVPVGASVNEYEVNAVAGNAPFQPGSIVQRTEWESPLAAGLRGVVQHLHYTSKPQRTDLTSRSHTGYPAGPAVSAVLIPIRKSADWWAMAHDERAVHFHGGPATEEGGPATPGHTAIGSPYADTIFRKLYHARYYQNSPYDFLTYFEFPSSQAAKFRELLAGLRDTDRNPEWKYVEEECEIWMTKLK